MARRLGTGVREMKDAVSEMDPRTVFDDKDEPAKPKPKPALEAAKPAVAEPATVPAAEAAPAPASVPASQTAVAAEDEPPAS